jgi:hypothetical protein
MDEEIISRVGDFGNLERIRSVQVGTLNGILEWGRLGRMIENEALNGNKAYTLVELFDDLRKGIWSELPSGRRIDVQKEVYKGHILKDLNCCLPAMSPIPAQFQSRVGPQINASQSDIRPLARGELRILETQITAAIPRTPTGFPSCIWKMFWKGSKRYWNLKD